MPLIKSKSDKARNANIKELIKSGRDPKQAEAIGYAEQRRAEGKPLKKPHPLSKKYK